MLAFTMCSFVIRQGLSIIANLATGLAVHHLLAGLLPGVVSSFVSRQGLNIIANLAAGLAVHHLLADLLPGVVSSFVITTGLSHYRQTLPQGLPSTISWQVCCPVWYRLL